MLAASSDVVATADAWVLDRCEACFDLPAAAIEAAGAPAWIVDLDA